ncbi:metal-dependent hydrolase [Nevskia ramosa]|uniref:metal-dependent hydrolase n=1 Tax=Nevskia ramosa TaxID=64002 RepID=UPI003D115BA8
MSATTRSAIVSRKVKFDWENAPLHWLRDDPFTSHAINEFSYLLVEGERFFCRLFREALPLVNDPQLRADVQEFIKQEAVHSRAHHDAINGYLKRIGISGGAFERTNVLLFTRVLESRPFGRQLPKRLERQWLVTRIGMVAAIEHFTAALGTFVIEAKSWEESGVDPVVADLFRWHGAEEIEHRSVAFDLYRHLGGRWPMRALIMGLIMPLLVQRITIGTARLMEQDPSFVAADANPFSLRFWRTWQRSADRGNVPEVSWFARQALRFLKPGYHPVHEASTEQALRYIASSPGVLAAA